MLIETKTFPAELAHLPTILAWVRDQTERTLLPSSEKMQVEVALEEAVVNVIHHSLKDSNREVTLTCRFEPKSQLEFILKDAGEPFNPLTQELPREDLPIEEQEEGGRGLLLMRTCMDSLLYRYEDNTNILTLIKKL